MTEWYCSHSNTPIDEALGKPYQDEILALISSYQQQSKAEAADSELDQNAEQVEDQDNM